MNNRFPLLDIAEQKTLFDALHYMKMDQLRVACKQFTLPSNGKKKELIDRITTFLKTGQIVNCVKIPAKSMAKNYPMQLLKPDSYMLYGSYKNDAKTRAFFTSLIGAHFHFTAFGIDWLNERWQQGLPPTYQQFADYWSKEMAWRKQHKNVPKDEWAFIKFLQRMQRDEPNARQEDLMFAWKELQQKQAVVAERLIEKAVQKL